jgi:two-component system, OmpR family, response regulator MtrA
MTRILVVEDSDNLRQGLCDMLDADGYHAIGAASAEQALAAARDLRPDLVILDLMLPDGDGGAVLHALRATANNPSVLVLTAKGEEDDKVRLFQLGADDYVTKPFGRRELSARVGALLRRAATRADTEEELIRVGDIAIDLRARLVSRAGTRVSLSPKEFDLLVALAQRRGAVVSRAQLLREVWRYEADVVSRTVDLHVSELRRALERDPAHPEIILTVWKVGYRMSAGAGASVPDMFGSR